MNLDYGAIAFLALEATLALVAMEVFIRYARWFATCVRNGDTQLLLKTMLLGIALTHFCLSVEALYWVLTRLIEIDYATRITDYATSTYPSRAAIRLLLVIGVCFHLVPIWRLKVHYTWPRVAGCILLRIVIASSLYAGAMQSQGVLLCYATDLKCYSGMSVSDILNAGD